MDSRSLSLMSEFQRNSDHLSVGHRFGGITIPVVMYKQRAETGRMLTTAWLQFPSDI
jgi:hypothetical protein